MPTPRSRHRRSLRVRFALSDAGRTVLARRVRSMLSSCRHLAPPLRHRSRRTPRPRTPRQHTHLHPPNPNSRHQGPQTTRLRDTILGSAFRCQAPDVTAFLRASRPAGSMRHRIRRSRLGSEIAGRPRRSAFAVVAASRPRCTSDLGRAIGHEDLGFFRARVQ